jgi:hypothetical protein
MKAPARLLFDLVTLFLLGITLVACLCAGAIFANPDVAFNPLKPAHVPTPLPFPTTVTAAPSPTRTASPTVAPTFTATVPVATPSLPVITPATATPFPTPVGPTETLTPTEQPTWTATPRPPRATATLGNYPGAPTATAGTPAGYP